MKNNLGIGILILMLLITTGCSKTKTLTCTYNNESVKYEIKDGKIINAYTVTDSGTRKATEEELEVMKSTYNSDSNEEAIRKIKDIFDLVDATCK